jgi:Serine dehydrogenase proteinase
VVKQEGTLVERYLLIWLAYKEEISPETLVPIRRKIEDLVAEPRDEVEIDLWLESPGGDAHTAYKLALMLRDVACHIRVVVPDYAKSAATLLALVGDEIYLAPGAELGPLDAQMPEEGSLSGAISALNIAHAADAVAEDAVTLAGTGGAQLLRRTGLSRAETMSAMLHFSAEFCEPLVRQLNPTLVHQAKESLRVTGRYAEQLLRKTTQGKASHIASQLVEDFPTHGCVIAYGDADRLGLPVKHISDYDHLPLLRAIHRFTEDDDYPLIQFSTLDEFVQEFADDPDDQPNEEQAADDQDTEINAGEPASARRGSSKASAPSRKAGRRRQSPGMQK